MIIVLIHLCKSALLPLQTCSLTLGFEVAILARKASSLEEEQVILEIGKFTFKVAI